MVSDALPMLDSVYAEWESFLQTGNLSKCKARQQVLESWSRSYQAVDIHLICATHKNRWKK